MELDAAFHTCRSSTSTLKVRGRDSDRVECWSLTAQLETLMKPCMYFCNFVLG